jgi:hypothetical protein
MEKKEIQQFLFNKYMQKQRDLVEDAVMAYGGVITKNGRILTVEEMESLHLPPLADSN